MYFLKSINYLDGTVTIGDLCSGESDLDIDFLDIPETCKHVGRIFGIRLAENGAIVELRTVTDIAASLVAFATSVNNAETRIISDGEIITKDESGREITVNAFDTAFLQTLLQKSEVC